MSNEIDGVVVARHIQHSLHLVFEMWDCHEQHDKTVRRVQETKLLIRCVLVLTQATLGLRLRVVTKQFRENALIKDLGITLNKHVRHFFWRALLAASQLALEPLQHHFNALARGIIQVGLQLILVSLHRYDSLRCLFGLEFFIHLAKDTLLYHNFTQDKLVGGIATPDGAGCMLRREFVPLQLLHTCLGHIQHSFAHAGRA